MRLTLESRAALYPHQVLAASVIKHAMTDLTDATPEVRSDALRFLLGSSGLRFWCEVAGFDVAAVVALARASLRQRRRPSFGKTA